MAISRNWRRKDCIYEAHVTTIGPEEGFALSYGSPDTSFAPGYRCPQASVILRRSFVHASDHFPPLKAQALVSQPNYDCTRAPFSLLSELRRCGALKAPVRCVISMLFLLLIIQFLSTTKHAPRCDHFYNVISHPTGQLNYCPQ